MLFLYVILIKLTDLCVQLGAILSDGPTDSIVGPQDDTGDMDLGKDRRPYFRKLVVHHDRLEESNVQHLHHIFVFERIRDQGDRNRRFALGLKALVQRAQTFVITGSLAHMHGFACEIVERCNRRGLGTGHHQLRYRWQTTRGDEVHDFEPFCRDRQITCRDVAEAVGDVLQHSVASTGNHDHGDRGDDASPWRIFG